MAFYGATAGILPVLFVALIFERKFFEPPEDAIDPLLDVMLVIVFFFGEIAALWALAEGKSSPSARALVATPLVVAALGLVAPITGPRLRIARDRARSERQWFSLIWAHIVAFALYAPPIGIVVALWARAFL